ncbi:Uncharacterised protein [uncultured archaeon]|nr:Uncharacterised protein [uncultured archaeon]
MRKRRTIEDMQALALSKHGRCISSGLKNVHSKLKWQCSEGHEWETKAYHVCQGHWCPYCSRNVSERICRKFFETIFGESFPKSRPKWLMGQAGKPLELDGYCEKLSLAFEYNGIQHYKTSRIFHTARNLEGQKRSDALKREICAENHVMLIEVPHEIGFECMTGYILAECRKKGVALPAHIPTIDFRNFDVYSTNKERADEMRDIVKKKGGAFLTGRYINCRTKHVWQCEKGHIWATTPRHIKQGKWCPRCAIIKMRERLKGKRRKTSIQSIC